MAQNILLEARNLSIRNTSVQGINFDAREREIIALFGRKNSGKTLVLLAIANYIDHTGKIVLKKKVNPRKTIGTGFFEKVNEPNELETVKDYLELLAGKAKVPERLLDRRFNELSGLEKSLVGLAKAMSGNPEIILLDEPTKDLTREEKAIFWNSVPRDRTIIFSTKDEDEARLAKVIVRL